jgi:hypothetical protein
VRALAPANSVDNGDNGRNWQSTNASLTYNNGATCNCNCIVTGADWRVSTANAWTVNRNCAVIFRVPNGYSVSTSVAHSMRIFLLENFASSTHDVYLTMRLSRKVSCLPSRVLHRSLIAATVEQITFTQI